MSLCLVFVLFPVLQECFVCFQSINQFATESSYTPFCSCGGVRPSPVRQRLSRQWKNPSQVRASGGHFALVCGPKWQEQQFFLTLVLLTKRANHRESPTTVNYPYLVSLLIYWTTDSVSTTPQKLSVRLNKQTNNSTNTTVKRNHRSSTVRTTIAANQSIITTIIRLSILAHSRQTQTNNFNLILSLVSRHPSLISSQSV